MKHFRHKSNSKDFLPKEHCDLTTNCLNVECKTSSNRITEPHQSHLLIPSQFPYSQNTSDFKSQTLKANELEKAWESQRTTWISKRNAISCYLACRYLRVSRIQGLVQEYGYTSSIELLKTDSSKHCLAMQENWTVYLKMSRRL